MRSSDYSALVDAIATKINSWPRLSRLYAGKIELIRSVVQGMECFWLFILPLPAGIIDKIYSLGRKFIWPTKHPPIAFKMLCKSLEDGGLGLKNMRDWNKAMLTKTLWKIHLKTDSLWIRWVNHIYSCFCGVWYWRWCKDESPLIKQILHIRDEIVQRLGSVENAISYLDSWFSEHHGLSRVYKFFNQSRGLWSWKPVLKQTSIQPKHQFLLWLFTHGRLLTRDRLIFVMDKTCVLCNAADESITHLYFSCHISKFIWQRIRVWLQMNKAMGSLTSVLRAFRTTYRGNSTLMKMRSAALASTIHHIWMIRNRLMFENEAFNVEDTINKIKIDIFRCIPRAIDMII